jgi:hypothetical protein
MLKSIAKNVIKIWMGNMGNMIKQWAIRHGKRIDQYRAIVRLREAFKTNFDIKQLFRAYIGILLATLLWYWQWKHGGLGGI